MASSALGEPHSAPPGLLHGNRVQPPARFDHVTGLASRALFEERLERAVAQADRSGRMAAVVLVRADGAHGPLLKDIGERLNRTLRPGDAVARIGDELFGVVLHGLKEVGGVTVAIRTIKLALAQAPMAAPPCLGAAVYPLDAGGRTELVERAGVALQRASAGDDEPYPDNGRWGRAERSALAREVMGALHRREVNLLFEPVLDLHTSYIAGAEAHVRWPPGPAAAVGPERLMPILEGAAVLDEMSEWLVASVGRFNASWRDRGLDGFSTSVALPGAQLRRLELPELVADVLERISLDPSALVLAIEEDAFIDDAQAEVTLIALESAGVRISIDGFGVGQSSLQALRRLPVDFLRLDPAFVAGIGHDPTAAALGRGLVALSHSLGIEVVAEGVTTGEQLSFLRSCGCDAVQGPLVGPALPGDEFERWVWASSFAPVA